MTKRLTIKNHIQEKQLFQRRIVAATCIILILTAFILARLFYLQIYEHKLYTTLSQQNQLSLLPIAPNRGAIYDRNGIIIAQNIPMFSLEIIPDKISNMNATIESLQTIIPISNENLQEFHKQLKQRRRFETVPIRAQLTDEEVARFYVNQHLFPGVIIEAQLMRYYPFNMALVDVLGYVGRINVDDLKNMDNSNYIATNFIGKVGIEKYYENNLHGKVGYKQVEIDASGRVIRTLKITSPIPGDELHLTIDTKLQLAAKEALSGLRGAVVAIEPSTGEVLALVSNPSYDPNKFIFGISKSEYQQLQNSSDRPLYNRAIRGQYPMGSIIKPFIGLTALQKGIITKNYKLNDPGVFQFKNSSHQYRDWKKGGHGYVDLKKAITVSCNTYFYELAVKLGIDELEKIMRNFGFGDFTKIDLGEELPGLVPNPAWKQHSQGTNWFPGDTVLSGIGQGYVLATPLQMAMAVSGLANQGQLYFPHLLSKRVSPNSETFYQLDTPLPSVHFDQENWDYVINAMQDVIRSQQGTGYRFGAPAYTVAAKTGTAQLVRKKDKSQKDNTIPDHLKDNSVFIAFAPVEAPKIALAVIVENSTLAPNVARKVIDNYLLRENNS